MTHLNALQVRLSNERSHLDQASSSGEKALRTVWIAQIEKEIASEKKFLGIEDNLPEMTDSEILEALFA